MAITSLTKALLFTRTDDRDLIPLSAPTTDLGANSSSAVAGIAIGFSFTFDGTTYTTAYLSAFGFVRLAGAETTATNGNLFVASTSVILAPWWDNLETADTVGYLKHETQGTAPFRRFVVEWYANMQAGATAVDYDRAKFQLVLYESKNKVEFRYGTLETGGSPSRAAYSASLGVKGDTSVTATNYIDYMTTTRALGGSSSSTTSNLRAQSNWPATTYKLEPNWPMSGRFFHIGTQLLAGLQHPECEPAWFIANNNNWLRCNFTPSLVNLSPMYSPKTDPNYVCPVSPSADGRLYRVSIETYSTAGGTLTVDVGRDNAANPQPAVAGNWTSLATSSEVATAVGYRTWVTFTITVPSTALFLRFAFTGSGLTAMSIEVHPEPLTDFDPTVALTSGWKWMGLGQLRQQGAAVHPEWYNRAYRNVAKLAADLKQMLWSHATVDGADQVISGTAAAAVRTIACAPAAFPTWRNQAVTTAIYAYDSVDGGKLVMGERGGNVTAAYTVNNNAGAYRGQSAALTLVSDEPTIFATMDPAGNAHVMAAVVTWTPPFADVDLMEGDTPAPRLSALLALVNRIRTLALFGWSMTGLAVGLTQGTSGQFVCAWMVPPATKALKPKVARHMRGTVTALPTGIYGASSGAGGADQVVLQPPAAIGTDTWPPDLAQVSVVASSDRYDATPAAASDRLLESPTLALLTGGVRERVQAVYGVGMTLVPYPVDPSTI